MDVLGNPFELHVPAACAPGRADRVLTQLVEDLSRTQVQKAFKAGLILRSGQALRQRSLVQAGDVLHVQLLYPETATHLEPYRMDLDILYEDADLLALNKAPGQVVHPGSGTGPDTLVHGLLHYCRYDAQGALRPEPKPLSTLGGEERPGVVHRLDKDTSGVILFAKSHAAYLGLIQQFQARSLQKTYWAVVQGCPRLQAGVCEGSIERHPVQRQKMHSPRAGGRPALTRWTCLHRDSVWSLLECRPHTGRTHQIRVHLSQLGHPILADTLYGYKPHPAIVPVPQRTLLHAYRLSFSHPVSAQALTLEAPLPEDFLPFAP